MDRRTFLATAGATSVIALAGCSDDGSSAASGPTQTDSATPTPQPTPTQTATSTTEVYEIGEAFNVGSGGKTVMYKVDNVQTFENLGGEYGEDASGVFVVVSLTMVNQTGKTVDISSTHLQLADQKKRTYDADGGASAYLASDDRVEVEGISYDQLNPGLSTQGAVAFDVNPGLYYFLLVRPLGVFSNADPQLVDLGTLSSS